MRNSIILILFFSHLIVRSQTIIWSEDFNPYTDGTQNTTKWTTSAGNCDLDGTPGVVGNNFWGVRTTLGDKEFCCEDIEGLTCCTTGSGGQGLCDNFWLSENISISGYSNISISINFRVEGNMECGSCGTGRDQLVAQYKIDAGTWTNFVSVCGLTNGQANLECIDVAGGNTLNIRILLGNQADDEEWYFDDVVVSDQTCAIILPIELIYFSGTYKSEYDSNVLEWLTATEMNNKEFQIEQSVNGQIWEVIGHVEGAGNSSTPIFYTFSHISKNRVTYYRLNQIDYDGKSEYSNIISIESEIEKKDDILNVRYFTILGNEIYEEPKSGFYIKVSEFRWNTKYEKIWKQ